MLLFLLYGFDSEILGLLPVNFTPATTGKREGGRVSEGGRE